MHFFVLALVGLLSACTIVQQPAQNTAATQTGSQNQVPLHDSEAPIVVDTGSLLPIQQVLPSGVLEIGHPDAKHTLLLFTEFHCSYCADFHKEQLPFLLAKYVDTHLLKLQILPLLLAKYPNSADGAKGAFCASQQGKGLEMQHLLFQRPNKHRTSIVEYAKELELDEEAMNTCLTSEETAARITEQQNWAQSLDVTVVPTFFLDDEKFVGLPYYADLEGRIESVLQ